MLDYCKFYNLEQYLFDEVGQRYRKDGKISSLDFFLILHWKSPRAKTRARDRLKKKVESFDRAIRQITTSLHKENDPKKRLQILMQRWGFRLPTATAILTVLYPDCFTVYDVRVRKVVGFRPIKEIYSERTWDATWKDYLAFKKRVIAKTPRGLCLRDRDRFLWGKSLFESAKRDHKK